MGLLRECTPADEELAARVVTAALHDDWALVAEELGGSRNPTGVVVALVAWLTVALEDNAATFGEDTTAIALWQDLRLACAEDDGGEG